MRVKSVSYWSDKVPQMVFCMIAGQAGIVIGTVFGLHSPSTRLLCDEDYCVEAVWTSAGYFFFGAVLGALFHAPLATFCGYPKSMAVCDLIIAAGWLILLCIDSETVATSQILSIGRFVQGLGAGGLELIACTYITHITDYDVRGRAQVFNKVLLCFGVSYVLNMANMFSFDTLIGWCIVWPISHLFLIFILPESPYHQYKKHDAETVKRTMRKIKGPNFNAKTGYSNLKSLMKNHESKYCVYYEKFTKTAVVGLGLVIFQQLCGVGSLTYHMEEVFRTILDSESTIPQIITIFVAAIQFVLCIISMELVEFLGRKIMLIVSALGMGICLLAMMLYYVFQTDACADEWYHYVPIVLIILYIAFYSIGWGPVVMLVFTEIGFLDRRVLDLINGCGQSVMFFLSYTYFSTNTLTGNTYLLWIYISSCFASVAFVVCFVPETRGALLNQIHAKMENENGLTKLINWFKLLYTFILMDTFY